MEINKIEKIEAESTQKKQGMNKEDETCYCVCFLRKNLHGSKRQNISNLLAFMSYFLLVDKQLATTNSSFKSKLEVGEKLPSLGVCYSN